MHPDESNNFISKMNSFLYLLKKHKNYRDRNPHVGSLLNCRQSKPCMQKFERTGFEKQCNPSDVNNKTEGMIFKSEVITTLF
jgi:hypothetical protein